MKSARRCVAAALIVMALPVINGSAEAADRPGCRTLTVEEARQEPQLFSGIFGSTAEGVLLIVERESKPVVLMMTGALFLKELIGLAKDVDYNRQLRNLGLKAHQQLQVCPAENWLFNYLGFRRLSPKSDRLVVAGPPGVASDIANVGSLGLLPSPTPPWRSGPNSAPTATSPKPQIKPGISPPVTENMSSILAQIQQLQHFTNTSPVTLAPKQSTPPPPAPAAPRRAAPSPSYSFVRGSVRDGQTGQPLWGAAVRLTSVAFGSWLGTVTLPDGTFAFANLPDGDYVISVYREGYLNNGRRIALPRDTSALHNFSLFRYPRYPCYFAVVNSTPWVVRVGVLDPGAVAANFPPSGFLQPHDYVELPLVNATQLFVEAVPTYGPLPLWDPIPIACGGRNYVKIMP